MSLYPSLEDLKVDQMAKAEVIASAAATALAPLQPLLAASAGQFGGPGSLYGGLGLEELVASYGGLDVSALAVARYMPADVALAMTAPGAGPLVSVTSPTDAGIMRSEIKQGVREVILAKDGNGKMGIATRSVDKGVFVAFVWRESAAALGGLRFGDQILQINGETVAGWDDKKTLKFLQAADPRRISIAVRDRPWCRTITLVKDSVNHVGFAFKKGEIRAIVKDSSAARNGLLISHYLVEVNGQNVVGMNDDEMQAVLTNSPRSVTLTIMPSFIYEHLVDKIGFSKIRKFMDHSVPEL